MFGKNTPSVNIQISNVTIMKVLLFVAGLGMLYIIADIVVLLFIAIVLASAIEPMVSWLYKRAIPRVAGALIIYIGLLGVVALMFSLLIPAVAKEVSQLSQELPAILDRFDQVTTQLVGVGQRGDMVVSFQEWSKALGSVGGMAITNVFHVFISIFGGIASAMLILVLSFYMVIDKGAMRTSLIQIMPDRYQKYITDVTGCMQDKIGQWLKGQVLLMLTVGLLTLVALLTLHIKYALLLALLAGMFEIVPVLGPIFAAIPALFFASTQSLFALVSVLIIYIVVQQIENHLLAPKIMQKAVGFSPIVTIVVLLIGAKLGGQSGHHVFGALIAIPVATAVNVLIQDFFGGNKELKRIEESST